MQVFLPLSRFMQALIDPIPFALAEIMLPVLLLFILLRFRPCRLAQWAAEVLCTFSTALLLYAALWGPLYACTPLPSATISAVEVQSLCTGLIETLNDLAPCQAASNDITAIAQESVRLMNGVTGRPLSSPKIAWHSGAFHALGIAGIYFPFTFESILSSADIAPALRFTACHELAHQAGWAREEEASFIALIACLQGDEAFQYSGYFSLMTSAMRLLHALDEAAWQACVQQMNALVLYDFRCANGLNEAIPSPIRRAQEQMNDVFLRINGQSAGLISYDGIVALALACPSIFP